MRQSRPACGGSERTRSTSIISIRKTRHASRVETVRAMGDSFGSGKIRYFGLSNHRAEGRGDLRLCDDSARSSGRQPALLQCDEPNARGRASARVCQLRPRCRPYSPLARGILTGKYTARRLRRRRDPGGPAGYSDAGDGVAPGIVAHRSGHQSGAPRLAGSPRASSRSPGF